MKKLEIATLGEQVDHFYDLELNLSQAHFCTDGWFLILIDDRAGMIPPLNDITNFEYCGHFSDQSYAGGAT